MGFRTVPNTVPWYQWTYGVVYGEVYMFGNGLVLLDNGELWACLQGYPSASQGGSQTVVGWIGTVTPDGAERKFGDIWAKGKTGSDAGLASTDTFAPDTNVSISGPGNSHLFSDGTTLYVLQGADYGGGNEDGPAIFRLDPDTLELEWVALDFTRPAPGGGTRFVDNHDAKQADSVWPRRPVYWPTDGAFYFWDTLGPVGVDGEWHQTLRRWDPTEGSISTVTPALNDPAAMNGPIGPASFNTATGLPHGLDSDMVATGRTGEIGSVIKDNWLYFIGTTYTGGTNEPANRWFTSWIRRIDLSNPSNGVETLYYGLGGEWTNLGEDDHRDWYSDYAATPGGVLETEAIDPSPDDYWAWMPAQGTPDLLGFMPTDPARYGGALCLVGDDLVFNNNTTHTYIAGGIFVQQGQMLCAIDLPTLLQRVADNDGNPIRHDRADPLFRTIASGATNDHAHTYYNRNWVNEEQPHNSPEMYHIDGGFPAFTVMPTDGLVSNENAPGWEGKAVFLTPSADNSLAWHRQDQTVSAGNNPVDSSQAEYQAHVIKVIEPKGVTDRDFTVEFSFEGRALRGYGPAVGMEQADAPEEVILQ